MVRRLAQFLVGLPVAAATLLTLVVIEVHLLGDPLGDATGGTATAIPLVIWGIALTVGVFVARRVP